jgi:hypothetical protein
MFPNKKQDGRRRLSIMSTHPVNCPEVIGKTVKSLKLYSTTGTLEEIVIEFTDGTSFTASCESRLAAKASLIRTGSAAPETLKSYLE